jgi:hypothetical protein
VFGKICGWLLDQSISDSRLRSQQLVAAEQQREISLTSMVVSLRVKPIRTVYFLNVFDCAGSFGRMPELTNSGLLE